MKTKPDIKRLAVEIYKVALRGAGESVKDRIPWDDLDGHDQNALIAMARWHLSEIKNRQTELELRRKDTLRWIARWRELRDRIQTP